MPQTLSRRQFLQTTALGAAGLCLPGRAWGASENSDATTPPNVLLILADDMGFSDIGCYGSEIRTPNIDRLGREGVRFSTAYNTARCCPSRAALLTGLCPHQAGVGFMVGNYGTRSYQGFLREDCATIADTMRGAGYHTWLTGKWHVGGNQTPNDPSTWHPGTPDQPSPLDRGFDRFFGTLGGAGSYYRPPMLMDQDKFITEPIENFYYTDAIGERACGTVRESVAAKKPFFGYMAFTAPHWPLHALPEDIERYRTRYRDGWEALRVARHEALKKLGIVSPKWLISPRDPSAPTWESLDPKRREWESMRMAVYAAMIDRMDQNIGRVLDCLETTGQRKTTLVVFLADNGGCAEQLNDDGSNIRRYDLPNRRGEHPRLGNIPGLVPGGEDTFQSYGLPWANASNSPFRKFKRWVHEGGIATPLIVHDPRASGDATRGRIAHDPCHVIDVLPTIAEFTGAKTLASVRNQSTPAPAPAGVSLAPVATGRGALAERALFWEHAGNRAVRLGSTKIVADNGGPWELYDLAEDRTEQRDLAVEKPDVVKMLGARYDTWAREVGVIDFATLEKKFNLPKD